MKFSLLVLSAPGSGHGSRTAAQFAHSAIATGHAIYRVFFLNEGTVAGSNKAVFAQDEENPTSLWIELARQHQVDLVLCVSSALKRGMLDEAEAERYERPGATIDPAFTISGLGQLLDACNQSDRVITFGG